MIKSTYPFPRQEPYIIINMDTNVWEYSFDTEEEAVSEAERLHENGYSVVVVKVVLELESPKTYGEKYEKENS